MINDPKTNPPAASNRRVTRAELIIVGVIAILLLGWIAHMCGIDVYIRH